MRVKRLPKELLEFPPWCNPPMTGKWTLYDQYIVDGKGRPICQWGSYTTKKNARLICDSVNKAMADA